METGKRFQDKVCLVTGGGSGIGLATCQAFAAEGAHVLIIDINEQHGSDAVKTVKERGGDAVYVRADVASSADIQAAIKTAVDKWGKIDVVVNNAAMMTFSSVIDLAEDDWDKVQAVNLRSVFLFCKYSIPHMSGGAIVNISSVHAHETTANVSPYAASKGGMEAFTRALTREQDPKTVRVNCVAPGAVDTPMLWANPNVKSGKETIRGAIGKPADLAAAILFIASDDARYINGTTLVADGGRLDIL